MLASEIGSERFASFLELFPVTNVETDAEETFKWLVAPVRLRPQESALVAVEQESGQFWGFARGPEISPVNRLLQNVGKFRPASLRMTGAVKIGWSRYGRPSPG